MDAKAYLQKQGWRGSGHSLDHTNRGITRPLLVSKKVDVLGLGLNKHAAVSDQWWLRAFDQGLKTLGTGEESALAQAQKHGVNRGGLYARFIKGEGVAGTFDEAEIEKQEVEKKAEPAVSNPKWKPVDMDESSGRKRKREDGEREEKRAKRKADRAERAKGNHVKEESVKAVSDERKAKRLAKEAKREAEKELKKAQKAATRAKEANEVDPEAVAAKKAAKAAKKAVKLDGFNTGVDKITLDGAPRINGHKPTASDDKGAKALKPEKLDTYTKRAAEKGISLEEYIRRRDEKTAKKSSQKSLASLGVVVDTTGAADPPQTTNVNVKVKEPVPLDPSLWEGKNVEDLPRDVREARRQWMHQDKEKGSTNKEKEKTRAQTKHKERGTEERALLSAVATATGPTVKLSSGKEYPTWQLEGKDGQYTENDTAMARRRVRHSAKVENQVDKRGATGERAKKNNRNRAKQREKYRKKSEVKAENAAAAKKE